MDRDSPGEELLRTVAGRYGMGCPITARRLTGGYANDVFRLDGAGPPTVLHVKNPPADGPSVDWEHRLLAEVNVHLPEALPEAGCAYRPRTGVHRPILVARRRVVRRRGWDAGAVPSDAVDGADESHVARAGTFGEDC